MFVVFNNNCFNFLKKNERNTNLYYIQYAYARCCQIFEKIKEEKIIIKLPQNINIIENKIERKIVSLLFKFTFVLEKIISYKEIYI